MSLSLPCQQLCLQKTHESTLFNKESSKISQCYSAHSGSTAMWEHSALYLLHGTRTTVINSCWRASRSLQGPRWPHCLLCVIEIEIPAITVAARTENAWLSCMDLISCTTNRTIYTAHLIVTIAWGHCQRNIKRMRWFKLDKVIFNFVCIAFFDCTPGSGNTITFL